MFQVDSEDYNEMLMNFVFLIMKDKDQYETLGNIISDVRLLFKLLFAYTALYIESLTIYF